jgi:hypothetical protein
MTFLETERKKNEAYRLRERVFTKTDLPHLAQIFRDLVKLSEMKIKLLKVYEAERDEMFGL